jgi:Zn-dependent peptidase ImmA (M78 family)
MQFERGFKSWSERVALAFRKDLSLRPDSPLTPTQLAEHLGVRVCTPNDIIGIPAEVLHQLLNVDPWGWSAVSIFETEFSLIIFNPRHSVGRRASDVMHELAHLVLDHKPASVIVSQDGSMVLRSYNARQEDEANWLAGCLLLPRDALLRCKHLKLPVVEVAHKYGVSEKLAVFRMRITGVDRQWEAATRQRG